METAQPAHKKRLFIIDDNVMDLGQFRQGIKWGRDTVKRGEDVGFNPDCDVFRVKIACSNPNSGEAVDERELYNEYDYLMTREELRSGNFSHVIQEELRRCDGIITDFNYREGDTGVDFLERVKRINGCSNKPMVIHSGEPREVYDEKYWPRAEALGLDAKDIFKKPAVSDLMQRIESKIAAAALEKQ